jgi:hypothetical protein
MIITIYTFVKLIGETEGFTSKKLADKKSGYTNPIRELLQNSLDASKDAGNNKYFLIKICICGRNLRFNASLSVRQNFFLHHLASAKFKTQDDISQFYLRI